MATSSATPTNMVKRYFDTGARRDRDARRFDPRAGREGPPAVVIDADGA